MAGEHEQYENLANGIIMQACKDYKRALKKLKKNPNKYEHLKTKRDCEKFFRSQWFKALTNLNGQTLMDKLKNSVAK